MLLSDFEAVVYDGEVYCTGCLPRGIDTDHDDVTPIFAGDEVESEQVCCECGQIHTYMNITGSDESDILESLSDDDPDRLPDQNECLPIQEDDSCQ